MIPSVLQQFEAQTKRVSDSVAVVDSAGSLSYAQLNRLSDQLAGALQRRGIGPDALVGVCLERSLLLPAALLGILKAGAGCLPLDPAYPESRRTFMCADAGVTLVLTQKSLAAQVSSGIETLCLDTDWPAGEALPSALPTDFDGVFYVIYTSGSTGAPKGVRMGRRAIANLAVWQGEASFKADARTAQFAALGFDVSAQEIFSTLCGGGTLVLVPEPLRSDPYGLLDFLDAYQIERLFLPFVALQQMAAAWQAQPKLLDALREVITAGEQLKITPAIRALFGRLPNCTLTNQYGPSETHVATAYTLTGPTEEWPDLPPIGRPVPGMTALVRGGELHLGGIQLAKGYVGKPELTGERFLEKLDGTERGTRWYRTGDLARLSPAGEWEFLGRADGQLKIRGFRVEPGEVETALLAFPGVKEAAVRGFEFAPGDTRLVAYLTVSETISGDALRGFLEARLPDYLVPTRIETLDALPLTPSGKVDYWALPPPSAGRPSLGTAFTELASGLEQNIAQVWQSVLGVAPVGADDSFFDLGGRSLQMVQVHQKLREHAAPEVEITTLFQYPTVRTLARFLMQGEQIQAVLGPEQRGPSSDAIAIVGLAGRFPGAANAAEFWENLKSGTDSLTPFTDAELSDAGINAETIADPDYVKARGFLKDVDKFDAAFFGIPPKEADVLDPQHRLFLECASDALEDAGCDPETYPGTVGVWAGSSLNTYLLANLCGTRDAIDTLTQTYQVGNYPTLAGNDKDFLATRVSYKLNLTGPSLSVGTGCSTSLVAVAQACQSLQTFACDMALAGGVSVAFPQTRGYQYLAGGMVSPDGKCRAFSADAQGTVFGGGVGVVALKRLTDAVRDGDAVYAVIKGYGLSNDGSQKASYTAPSADGQAQAISAAHTMAGVNAETISYVEAHGTATPLGDPIEIAGLTKAFRRTTSKIGYCALGSVKPNVGHLEAASGVTGLIKTALALKHKTLPPSLYFDTPNPRIGFANTPFVVNTQLRDWPETETPRRAGVSSFGVGGTNAHVVLEEAPAPNRVEKGREWQLLTLSARTETALETATDNLAKHFKAHPEVNLADVAWTLGTGRRTFAHRRMLVCRTAEEAANALETRDTVRLTSQKLERAAPPIAFLFPGQGAQSVGMGRELYNAEPVFRGCVDECAELLVPLLGLDIRKSLYPNGGDEAAAQLRLNQTALAQPALFVFGYALARLWQSCGIAPSVMLGHSVGEYVAACLAGVFTLADALTVLAGRARLMQALPPGGMLAVRQSASDTRDLLGGALALAAENSPSLCVVSGPNEAVEALEARLTQDGVACRRLPTSHAFHSAMMDPILTEFAEIVKSVPRSAPAIPFVSNVSGTGITDAEAVDPSYWADHLRGTVRFADGLGTLLADPNLVLLEVGPNVTLAPLARQHPAKTSSHEVLSSLDAGRQRLPPDAAFLSCAGRLWLSGAKLNWTPARRVSLPTYPFERMRHWVEPAHPTVQTLEVTSPMPILSNAVVDRTERLLGELSVLLSDQSGVPISGIAPYATFLELGFDSLFLTQAGTAISRKFGVKVTFRTLLEDAPTPASLAKLLDQKLPPDAAPVSVPAPVIAAPLLPATPTPAGESGPVQQIINSQLQLMAEQLALLRGAPAPAPIIAPVPVIAAAPAQPTSALAAFGPFKPIDTGNASGLNERQAAYLSTFIEAYAQKTPESKRLTQLHRPHLADPRAVAGFKPYWKEIVYPIVAERSVGASLWDADGHKHVDVTMGFGTNLFGHSPAFIADAIKTQLALGIEIGPQSRLAGEVARLVCEMTGADRATFCCTGSEAVMAAMRAARTVTGRDKIVYFTGDYHGTFDEVLARSNGVGESRRAVPIAPGIPECMMGETIILEYGTPETLEELKRLAPTLAAVLVEPVQSRRPDWQPAEFLREVRKITENAGAALIFDEVITGFRIGPGGAQAEFGVKADLVTYGKIVGGGLPMGIVTGKSEYMDAFDGGQWQFGDDSRPEVGVTFFAGTFVRHPLALAAAKATLEHLKAAGPRLQRDLNARTTAFVQSVNADFDAANAPVQLTSFGSLFYFKFAPEFKWASLLFFHLRFHGVHIWEGRPCFLSTAHTDADLALIAEAFRKSVREMQAGGFLSAPPPPEIFPLTEGQRGVWLTTQMGTGASCAFNESVRVDLTGPLDSDALSRAVSAVVQRHPALRTAILPDGETQQVLAQVPVSVPVSDWSDALAEDTETAFDLSSPPLIRFRLLRKSADAHCLVITAHHLVCDGWSFGVLLPELAAAYAALSSGDVWAPAPAPSFQDYAAALRPEAENQRYWTNLLTPPPMPLRLPTDRARLTVSTYAGARESRLLPPSLVDALKQLCRRSGTTLSALLLSAYTLLLHGLAGTDDTVVWVPSAGQALQENAEGVGHCVSLLPLRVPASAQMRFSDYLAATRTALLSATEHQTYSLGGLMQALDRPVPITTTFNIDQFSLLRFGPLTGGISHPPRRFFQFDLGLNVIEDAGRLELECDYSTELFDAGTIETWLTELEDLLQTVTSRPDVCLEPLTARLRDASRPTPPAQPQDAGPNLRSTTALTETETRLASLWREVLGVQIITATDNFFEKGGYSLLALRLYGRIEQEFGVRLPLPTLFQAPTLEALAEVITQKTTPVKTASSKPNSTLVALKPTGKKPPFYCIHPDHGLVLFYQALANRLPVDQPVYGLQSVGVDSGETPLTSLGEMAARYLRDIKRFQPDGPYHLGGYSFGGVVAAEMARQLHGQGEQVGLVALFDTYAPVAYQQHLIDKPRLRRLAGHLQMFKGSAPLGAWRALGEKAHEAIHGKETDWQKAAKELADILAPEQLATLRSVIEANEAAFFEYETPVYPVRATLFRATEVSVFEERDPALWWGDRFSGGLDIHDIPSAHLSIMKEPLVQALAAALALCLDEASA